MNKKIDVYTELRQAWIAFFTLYAESLKIPQLLTWLNNKIAVTNKEKS